MIFPLRVFGSSSVNTTVLGRAIGPIFVGHVGAELLARLVVGRSPASARRVTKATIACPVVGSVAPTTAASATAGWSTRADSTSVVEIR